jgi:hypothetical protein
MAHLAYYQEQAEELAKLLENPPELKMPQMPASVLMQQTVAVKQLSAAEVAALPSERQINVVREELIRLMPELTKQEATANAQRLAANPQIQREIELLNQGKIAHEAFERAVAQGMGVRVQSLPIRQQFIESIHQEIDAVRENMAASSEEAAKGFAGLIGGRRAQAAVEAVWETGRGIACLAEGVMAADPAAIVAAALHFEAAAQYALVAGSGSGGHSASSPGSSAGGGSGSGSRSGSGSGSHSGSGSGSGGGASMPGAGTTIHMHIQGMVSADTMQQFFAQANDLVKGGQLVVNSTTALYKGATLG